MKKRLKVIPLLLSAMMIFGACSSSGTGGSPTATPTGGSATDSSGSSTTSSQSGSTTDAATDSSEPALLRMRITAGLNTCNPLTAESGIEYMHQQWINANLYKRMWNEDLQIWTWAPELADGEPIDVNGDGSTWQIKLRQGYTFEDGTPIDANVVDYTTMMALNPQLAMRNTNIGKILDNGNAYYLNEISDWSEVGIRVVDDYTIEYTISEEFVPYDPEDLKEELAFVGSAVIHPEMFESCFNADRTENTYGTTPDRFVAGGAYTITNYIDGQYVEMQKRTDNGHPYAEDGTFTVDTLQLTVVVETNTALQMFQNDEIDIVEANGREYDDYPDVYYLYTPDNYGIFINSQSKANPVLQDANFRYAMYWGFDRETILGMTMPTNRVNPYHYSHNVMTPDPTNPSQRINIREQPEAKAVTMDGQALTDTGYNPDLALEYFEKAYVDNGSKKITVEMQYSEGNEERKAWAEGIQYHFNQLFSSDKFEMTLRAVPHATVYENMSRHGHPEGELPYDMTCTGGIYQSTLKPWTNNNWVYSGSDTYSSQYTLLSPEAAAEWDRLYYECTTGIYKGTNEESYRGKLVNSILQEQVLYDECTFIPAYTRGNRFLISERIEIPFESNVGDAYIEFALMQAKYN